MINWITKIIVKRELDKIKANSEEQFYDMLCNIYNNRNCFLKKIEMKEALTIEEVYELMNSGRSEDREHYKPHYDYMIEAGVNRLDLINAISWYEDENGRIYKSNKERIEPKFR